MNALGWFIAGSLAGGAIVLGVVLLVLRFASDPDDDAADVLWDEPWSPAPDPITEVTPTAAEQAAGVDAPTEPVDDDAAALIREVEDLLRRKANP